MLILREGINKTCVIDRNEVLSLQVRRCNAELYAVSINLAKCYLEANLVTWLGSRFGCRFLLGVFSAANQSKCDDSKHRHQPLNVFHSFDCFKIIVYKFPHIQLLRKYFAILTQKYYILATFANFGSTLCKFCFYYRSGCAQPIGIRLCHPHYAPTNGNRALPTSLP